MQPSYYRGCWHEVSRCFLWDRSILADFLLPDSGLHPEGLPPARGVAGSGFRPLPKIRYCSPPWGSGQCLSSDVAGQPLSPATRLRLGGPLPHQLADRIWAARWPTGPCGSPPFDLNAIWHRGLIRSYPQFPAAIPVPKVRYPYIPHPSATLLGRLPRLSRATCMC